MNPRFLACLIAAAMLGCAATSEQPGFADVERAVHQRTGHRVFWNRGSAHDQAVTDAVSEVLARRLTADDAVQIALLNNQDLQATYEQLGVAQAELVQAGLLRNPIFDAELKFPEGGRGTALEMAVVQDFLDIFLIPLRTRAAENSFEDARLRVTGAVIDLAAQVRAEFYSYVAAEQMLELRRSVATATEASHDLARRLREAGNITELDLANERALREQARLDLADAEAEVLEARERLNVLLGLWGEQVNWSAFARLPDPPAQELATDDVERQAVQSSLDLAVAHNDLQAAAQSLGLRRASALLTEAEAGAAAEREPEGDWAIGPAFSLPIPLFDQGQGRLLSARAEFERARRRYAAAAIEVRSAARSARNRLATARARAEYQRQVMLPLRRQITQQTQLQYNAMQASPFQLLAAKEAEIAAGAAYVQALRDYWIARTRLEQLVGGRIPRSSASPAAGGAFAPSTPNRNGDH